MPEGIENTSIKEVGWSAEEFKSSAKGLNWYLTAIGISIVLIVFAIWQGNVLFLIFVLLSAIVVFSLSSKKPNVIDFKVSNKGIRVGDNDFIDFDDLEGFDYHKHEDGSHEIVIRKHTVFNPFIRMPIDAKTAEEAVKVLKEHLEEKEYEESIVDTFTKFVGF